MKKIEITIDRHLNEAPNVEASLKKRIQKVGNTAQKLSDTRWKLEDEIEKIQKKMKIHGIDELLGVGVHEDSGFVVGNMMA